MKINLPTLALFTACATSLLAQDARVRAVGTVESKQTAEILSHVPGKTTVLWVIEEGTVVKKGDELLRLDKAALEEQVNMLVVNRHTSTASHAKAKAEHSIAMVKADGATTIRRMQIAFAEREHMAKLRSLELDVKQAESEIKIAQARLAAAQAEAVAWQKEHGDKKLQPAITLALTESRESLQVATRKRDHIDKVLRGSLTAAQDLKKMQMKIEQSQQRVQLQQKLAVAQANLVAAAETRQLYRAALDRALKSLSNAVIRAHVDGMIIHANRPSRSRPGGFILQQGAEVHEQQVLLQIPDLSKLQVLAQVTAKDFGLLKVGQPAQVTVDAFPNQTLEGVVRLIKPTPEPRQFAGQGEFYKVCVDLKPPHRGVRTGMAASIVIDTGDKPDRRQKRR